MKSIDLNVDTGEFKKACFDGTQERLMPFVTSLNIACGGHAGDDETMAATIKMGKKWKRAAGAHPGYPDPARFGRMRMNMSRAEIADTVYSQIDRLAKIAAGEGVDLVHVKPHGALYNSAVEDEELSSAIAEGVARFSKSVVLVGMAGSKMIEVFKAHGFTVAGETFADRAYDSPIKLRPREQPGAVLTDPEAALRQAISIVLDERVTNQTADFSIKADTICIHGDTPGAETIARKIFEGLTGNGVAVKPLALMQLRKSE